MNVADRVRADPGLVLRFGYNLNPAIGDLTVDDEAIAGTLTFAGQPFRCILPWTAVYAASVEGEQRGTVWPEDVPEDVLTGSNEAVGPTATPTVMSSVSPPAPGPTLAKSDDEPRAKRATHLKLVE